MNSNHSFLTDHDQETFYSQKGKPDWQRIIIRKVKPVDDLISRGAGSFELNSIYAPFIRSDKSFICHCIQVKDDDGMSWTAEIARVKLMEEITKEASPFQTITVTQFKNKLPQIVDIVGLKTFLRLAAKNKIVKDFYSFMSLSTIITCLAPVLVAVLTGILTNDLGGSGSIENLLSIKYLVIAAITLVLCLLGRYFIQKNEMTVVAQSMSALIDDIKIYSKQMQEGEEEVENSVKFEDLINDVARSLLSVIPKIVIY